MFCWPLWLACLFNFFFSIIGSSGYLLGLFIKKVRDFFCLFCFVFLTDTYILKITYWKWNKGMNLEENVFSTYSHSQWFSTHFVFLLSQSNWKLSLLNLLKEGRFRCMRHFLIIMVILTALESHLGNIQSEKLGPEGYPPTSSNNFIKKHEVCELWISVPHWEKGQW